MRAERLQRYDHASFQGNFPGKKWTPLSIRKSLTNRLSFAGERTKRLSCDNVAARGRVGGTIHSNFVQSRKFDFRRPRPIFVSFKFSRVSLPN